MKFQSMPWCTKSFRTRSYFRYIWHWASMKKQEIAYKELIESDPESTVNFYFCSFFTKCEDLNYKFKGPRKLYEVKESVRIP